MSYEQYKADLYARQEHERILWRKVLIRDWARENGWPNAMILSMKEPRPFVIPRTPAVRP